MCQHHYTNIILFCVFKFHAGIMHKNFFNDKIFPIRDIKLKIWGMGSYPMPDIFVSFTKAFNAYIERLYTAQAKENY